MQQALDKDPSIPQKKLGEQFKALILGPMLSLKPAIPPMVVVVDALDECADKDGVVKLITIIADAVQECPFHLRFFFTSRAHDHIEAIFRDRTAENMICHLPLEQWAAHTDIRVFLECRFRAIRVKKRRVMGDIPKPWSLTSRPRHSGCKVGRFIYMGTDPN